MRREHRKAAFPPSRNAPARLADARVARAGSRRRFGGWELDVAISRARKHALAAAIACLALAGCRQDMHDAPRLDALEASTFFSDGSAARVAVANTVARGQLREDEHLYAGRVNGQPATEFPMPVTMEMMERGRERFDVFCSPCHGQTGVGNGMIVQRGFRQPPSYHEERLVNAPVGYFFDVMTNGFGAMQDYSAQVPVADRWAIAAYIRALQFSRRASVDDVPADRRAELDQATPGADLLAPAGQGAQPGPGEPAPAPPAQENE